MDLLLLNLALSALEIRLLREEIARIKSSFEIFLISMRQYETFQYETFFPFDTVIGFIMSNGTYHYN